MLWISYEDSAIGMQERWLSLLSSESNLEELPETLDVRLKAEEFQNYAQQMENAVLSLAISVEEVNFAGMRTFLQSSCPNSERHIPIIPVRILVARMLELYTRTMCLF